MAKDSADEFPVAAEMFASADAILARKLTDVTWNGPIEEVTKTSNCQPALFVHGLACLAVLRELAEIRPTAEWRSYVYAVAGRRTASKLSSH